MHLAEKILRPQPFAFGGDYPRRSPRMPLFLIFALIGLVFGVLLYVPHGLHSDMVVVEINYQSLANEKSLWLDFLMPGTLTNVIYALLIIVPPAMSHYLHLRHFALTLAAVVVINMTLLTYAYISFFCLLASLATLHLVYITLKNRCARECPELFPELEMSGRWTIQVVTESAPPCDRPGPLSKSVLAKNRP